MNNQKNQKVLKNVRKKKEENEKIKERGFFK